MLPNQGRVFDLPPALPGAAAAETAAAAAEAGSNTVQGARATLSFVEALSSALERRVAECENALRRTRDRATYIDCISTELERYGEGLSTRIQQLPAPLRAAVRAIPQAARQIRAAAEASGTATRQGFARTVTRARAAVRAVAAEVRKAISLLRADEPAVRRLQIRTGETVESALKTVESSLVRAVGL